MLTSILWYALWPIFIYVTYRIVLFTVKKLKL